MLVLAVQVLVAVLLVAVAAVASAAASAVVLMALVAVAVALVALMAGAAALVALLAQGRANHARQVADGVTVVNLRFNEIADAGATALAKALADNRSITELHLGGNLVGAEVPFTPIPFALDSHPITSEAHPVHTPFTPDTHNLVCAEVSPDQPAAPARFTPDPPHSRPSHT